MENVKDKKMIRTNDYFKGYYIGRKHTIKKIQKILSLYKETELVRIEDLKQLLEREIKS